MTDYNELLERLDRCQRLEFARAAPYGVLPSRLHAEAATAIRTLLAERQAERAAIVAWLRAYKRDDTNWPQFLATAIEAGQHLGEQS